MFIDYQIIRNYLKNTQNQMFTDTVSNQDLIRFLLADDQQLDQLIEIKDVSWLLLGEKNNASADDGIINVDELQMLTYAFYRTVKKNKVDAVSHITTVFSTLLEKYPTQFITGLSKTTEEGPNKGKNGFWLLAIALSWADEKNDTHAVSNITTLFSKFLEKDPAQFIAGLSKTAEGGLGKGKNGFFCLANALTWAVIKNNATTVSNISNCIFNLLAKWPVSLQKDEQKKFLDLKSILSNPLKQWLQQQSKTLNAAAFEAMCCVNTVLGVLIDRKTIPGKSDTRKLVDQLLKEKKLSEKTTATIGESSQPSVAMNTMLTGIPLSSPNEEITATADKNSQEPLAIDPIVAGICAAVAAISSNADENPPSSYEDVMEEIKAKISTLLQQLTSKRAEEQFQTLVEKRYNLPLFACDSLESCANVILTRERGVIEFTVQPLVQQAIEEVKNLKELQTSQKSRPPTIEEIFEIVEEKPKTVASNHDASPKLDANPITTGGLFGEGRTKPVADPQQNANLEEITTRLR